MKARTRDWRIMLTASALLAHVASTASGQTCDSPTFTRTDIAAGVSARSVALGDLDGDGDLDLAVANSSTTAGIIIAGTEGIHIMLGNGDGTFAPKTFYPAGKSPQAVLLGDIDGDGDLDLLAPELGYFHYGLDSWVDGGVNLLRNDGSGSFGAAELITLDPTKQEPRSAALGDLDGDGDLDLVVSVANPGYMLGEMAVLVNLGSGTFASPVYYSTGIGPWSVDLGDLDGDGDLDAMTANWGSHTLSRLYGNGDGTFGPQQTFYGFGQYLESVLLEDLDANGLDDVAVINHQGVRVMLDNGNLAQYACGLGETTMAAGDVNGDGAVDVVVSNSISDNATLLINAGDGTFMEQLLPAGNAAYGPGIADIDSDGDEDVLIANMYDNSVTVLTNECPVATHCMAKLNSLGCLPTIGTIGEPTMTGSDDFTITATSVLNNQAGMFFFGSSPAEIPFKGGTLCVKGPFTRTTVQYSGGDPPPADCSGIYSFSFSQALMGQLGLVAGDRVFGQYWSRDPSHPDGTGVGLTDGIRFTVQP